MHILCATLRGVTPQPRRPPCGRGRCTVSYEGGTPVHICIRRPAHERYLMRMSHHGRRHAFIVLTSCVFARATTLCLESLYCERALVSGACTSCAPRSAGPPPSLPKRATPRFAKRHESRRRSSHLPQVSWLTTWQLANYVAATYPKIVPRHTPRGQPPARTPHPEKRLKGLLMVN